MANVKLIYRNILENSTVTPTTENSSYPKYRLYNRDIGKLFKGTAFASPFEIKVVQAGPVEDETGSTFNRGDFTAVNAFFWSSLDLSPYHGTDLGFTPYYIELIDAAGKKATGYIGAVGAGETLGSELFLNPDFGADTNWEKQTGWTIAAGVASNDGIAQGWLRQYVSPSIGKLVKMSVNITIATSGELYLLISPNFNPHLGPYNTIGIKSGYLIKDNDDLSIGMFVYPSFNGSIDDASAKRVTDPPPTAVHIVSSLNGTIRNWASIESGFNPNDIASWKIYHASLFSEVDRLIIPAGHNLNGLACSLRYSTDNFSADDHEAVGWTQGNALIISKSFTAQTKQYWKLNITAPATIVELTEMFLSKDYTFERNVNLNLNEEIQRNVERDQTKSGDPRWVKLGEKKESRVYDLIVESAQKINLDSWWSALDSVKPFYIFDHNGDLLFMEMLNELSFTPLSNNFWQTKMEFLEVL